MMDVQYQVTDLERRLKVLENKTRAVKPRHPSQGMTSVGQGLPGADPGLTSRITSAVEAGFSSIESVQDVNIASKTISFAGGATAMLYQTNYLRPDPIVGDTYRVSAGGTFGNTSGSSLGVTLQWSMAGNAASPNYVTLITTPNIVAGQTVTWWVLIMATVTTAGSAGAYLINARSSCTASLGGPGGAVGTDLISASPVSPINLVAPAPTLQVVGGSGVVTFSGTLNQYSLERLGANFTSKV